MKLTPDQLAAIRARAEAATEGPWVGWTAILKKTGRREAFVQPESRQGEDGIVCRAVGRTSRDARADMKFIAAARADVPALLAHVDALEAELAAERRRDHDTEEDP